MLRGTVRRLEAGGQPDRVPGAGAGDRRRRVATRCARAARSRLRARLAPSHDHDLAAVADRARGARRRRPRRPCGGAGSAAVRESIRDAASGRDGPERRPGAGPGHGRRPRRARAGAGGLPHRRADPPARRVGDEPHAGGRLPGAGRALVRGARAGALPAGGRSGSSASCCWPGPSRAWSGRRRWAPSPCSVSAATVGDRGVRALGVAVTALLLWDPWLAVSRRLRARACWPPRASCCSRRRWTEALGALAAPVGGPGGRRTGRGAAGLHAGGGRVCPARSAWWRWSPTCSPRRWSRRRRCSACSVGWSAWSGRPRGACSAGAPGCAPPGSSRWPRHSAGLALPAVDWGTGAGALAVLTVVCLGLAAGAWDRCWPGGRRGTACCLLLGLVVLVPLPSPGLAAARVGVRGLRRGPGRRAGAPGRARQRGRRGRRPRPALVDRCLDRLDVEQVPLLVLTHFHADHVDGLAGRLRRPPGRGGRRDLACGSPPGGPPSWTRETGGRGRGAGVRRHPGGRGRHPADARAAAGSRRRTTAPTTPRWCCW